MKGNIDEKGKFIDLGEDWGEVSVPKKRKYITPLFE